jgi:hypothetical protein
MANCRVCNNLELEEQSQGFRRLDFDFEDFAVTVEAGFPSCKVIYDGIVARLGNLEEVSHIALNKFDLIQTLHVTVWVMEGRGCEVFEFYTRPGRLAPSYTFSSLFVNQA